MTKENFEKATKLQNKIEIIKNALSMVSMFDDFRELTDYRLQNILLALWEDCIRWNLGSGKIDIKGDVANNIIKQLEFRLAQYERELEEM